MSDRNIADLHPDLQLLAQKFIEACAAVGIRVGLDETYRSNAEQDADYAIGRSVPGQIKTNARGGQSPHNCVLEDGTPAAKAFDYFIIGPDGKCDWNPADAAWQKAIAIGESLGLVNGSQWHTAKSLSDCDHFELPHWASNDIGQVQAANQD